MYTATASKLFILCGSPGSGKTTLSKKIAEEQNAIRLSFDEMGCLQHKELIQPVMKALRSGRSVVVDALFTHTAWRKMILKVTDNVECSRVLVYIDTTLEECLRRNSQRPNPLPEFMVRDIYNSIELPSLEEGWDDIWYFK